MKWKVRKIDYSLSIWKGWSTDHFFSFSSGTENLAYPYIHQNQTVRPLRVMKGLDPWIPTFADAGSLWNELKHLLPPQYIQEVTGKFPNKKWVLKWVISHVIFNTFSLWKMHNMISVPKHWISYFWKFLAIPTTFKSFK